MQTYELRPIYDGRKSFYGKAHVIEYEGKRVLKSYQTHVMEVKFNDLSETEDMFKRYDITVYGTYSATTLRHIREYLQQLGHEWYSKSEIEELFLCDQRNAITH